MASRRNVDGSYMSPDQIMLDLACGLSISDAVWIRRGMEPSDGLLSGGRANHFRIEDFLRSMRNDYGMWDEENPYVVIPTGDLSFQDLKHLPLFPDNLSFAIAVRLVDSFQEPPEYANVDATLWTDTLRVYVDGWMCHGAIEASVREGFVVRYKSPLTFDPRTDAAVTERIEGRVTIERHAT